ncbi:hypothetical protein [Marimonas lutisalis]|uniref:hypothetical protein n=1 Tax=Marimonas lutisalis TaxID=2545756 RepID=UPI0010F60E0B|nr:hypothetical protein [Marimonas lutisalis]
MKFGTFLTNVAKRFHKEEEGIALSEYLVLLGLLIGGVITAVLLFGTELGDAWDAWATWVGSLGDNAPS